MTKLKVTNTKAGTVHEHENTNHAWGDSFWSDSKFISSTGQVSLDVLMKYVESQNEPKVKK